MPRRIAAIALVLLAARPADAQPTTLFRQVRLLDGAHVHAVDGAPRMALAFGLADRGRIAPGLRADLVLVDGDPTVDVTAPRAIVGVWKQGVAVDRAARRAQVAAQRESVARGPNGVPDGLVSDFEGAAPTSSFGAGWDVSVDGIRGGRSTGAIALVPGGANGSRQALAVTGTVDASMPGPWAGALFSPGDRPFQPANLSSRRVLRFWARGDGREYAVLVFTRSRGFVPLAHGFVAGAEWAEHVVPFAALGTDATDVMAVIFAAGAPAGAFAFALDDVRIR